MITTINKFTKYINESAVEGKNLKNYINNLNNIIDQLDENEYKKNVVNGRLIVQFKTREYAIYCNDKLYGLIDNYTALNSERYSNEPPKDNTIFIQINNIVDYYKVKKVLNIYFKDLMSNTSIEMLNESIDVNEGNDFDSVATIGKITKNITIELDLKHSMHSMERQGRSTDYIKNTDIKESVDKATEQIIDLLINNTLNVGDPVWIYNSSNDLNVVGSLLANKNNDNITFRVITCMFHKNFYNKNNTYKVTV